MRGALVNLDAMRRDSTLQRRAPRASQLSIRRLQWIVPMVVLLGIAGTIGCRTRPVVIAAPPHLEIDTNAIGRRPDKPAPKTYQSIWHATTAGDLRAAQHMAENDEQRQLLDAMIAVLQGFFEKGEDIVTPLLNAKDSIVRDAAKLTYGAALSIQGKWGRLAQFTDSLHTIAEISGDTNQLHQRAILDEAGISAWARAFRSIQTTHTFNDSVTTLALYRALSGTPIIEVYVNGVLKRFWLDTGASLSILSSTTAADCGITPINNDTLALVTSIGRLAAKPAVIPTLHVGGLHVKEAAAMIVDANSLTLKVQLPAPNRAPIHGPNAGEELERSQEVRIDGVIGFDVIRLLDLTLDDVRGRVVIRRPVLRSDNPERPRNLFWFGLPIVRLTAANGQPLHLALDTGSDETYGTRTLATKTRARSIKAERRSVQGFGASATESGVVIPNVRIFLDTTPLLLERVFLYNARYPTIFDLDGTLGADISRGNVIRIDMTNGRFELR
jgi:predicted aspartyl protease